MEDLPQEIEIRDSTPVQIQTSVDNWLKIADILEEHADHEVHEGMPGWEFARQMAYQIRDGIGNEPIHPSS